MRWVLLLHGDGVDVMISLGEGAATPSSDEDDNDAARSRAGVAPDRWEAVGRGYFVALYTFGLRAAEEGGCVLVLRRTGLGEHRRQQPEERNANSLPTRRLVFFHSENPNKYVHSRYIPHSTQNMRMKCSCTPSLKQQVTCV